jgi:hypothetical protein
VNGVLFGCGADGAGYYVELQTTGIVLKVGGGSADKVWLTALGSYADDAWHHVACSFRNVDGDWQAALYVDGLRAVDWTACPTAVNGAYNMITVIGCRNWTWAGNFKSGTDALIDEVEFTTYGTYRSDDWIAATHAAGSSPATFATAGELVAVGGSHYPAAKYLVLLKRPVTPPVGSDQTGDTCYGEVRNLDIVS